MSMNPPSGGKRIVAVIVQFANQSSPPTTKQAVEKALLATTTSTDAVFRESSGGLLWIEDLVVVGPYKIKSVSGGVCAPGTWGSEARQMAMAQGIDLTKYDAQVYVSTQGTCTYRGLGGGTFAWISGAAAAYATHELGHCMGFGHASAVGSEYGDASDAMGGVNNALFGAFHRIKAGWQRPHTVKTVGSGNYEISLLDATSNRVQVLTAIEPDKTGAYYLSMRGDVGLDSRLPANYKGCVLVHHVAHNSTVTMRRAHLKLGESFTDPGGGLRFTVTGLTLYDAKIQVEKLEGVCVPAIPHLAVVEAERTVSVGEQTNIEVLLTDKSNSSCLSSDFQFSAKASGAEVGVVDAVVHTGPGVATPCEATFMATAPGRYKVSLMAWQKGRTPKTVYAYVNVTEPDEQAEPTPVPDDLPEIEPEPTPEPTPEPVPDPQPEPDHSDDGHDHEPIPDIPSEPATATILATHDTYLSSYHPSLAFGKDAEIKEASAYLPLVRFAVFQSQGGPVPDSARVVSAKLSMHKKSAYNGVYGLVPVLSDWSESTATLKLAPSLSGEPVAEAAVGWEPGWIAFDLTDEQLRANQFGWALKWRSGYSPSLYRRWASRNGDPEFAPRLVVEWQ